LKSWYYILIRFLLAALMSSTMSGALAMGKEIRIGVLSFRSLEQTRQQWKATADYLNQQVGGYHFSIVPMFYKELDLAVNRHDFDFVVTNPEHYITIRNDISLSAIVTLMPLAEGKPVTTFGGVILTRADRANINTLADLRGKVVAAPSEQSLGGYLMQSWTMHQKDLDFSVLSRIKFTGMPHDKVVMAVLEGKADVGFVRTGILESMAREGKIRLDQVKVINRQPAENFPQIFSTDLYPEWPFAAMPEVPDDLLRRVRLALLNIQPQDAAAQQGRYYGFAGPGNYADIRVMMQHLGFNPERAREFDLRDVLRKYALEFIGGAIALLLGVLLTLIHLARTNRRLRNSYTERERLDNALQQSNATLEQKVCVRTQELHESQENLQILLDTMAEGMYGVDNAGNCTFVNAAFLRILGFERADEVLGKHSHTLFHHSRIDGAPYPASECLMYQAFRQKQPVHCDTEVFWCKDGQAVAVEYWAHPIIKDEQVVGAVATFLDITERKGLELQLRDLAFYDPLTRLANRRLLLDRLGMALVSCLRTEQHGALMFLDLDYFKKLNDLHGHDMGDQLLVEVARRIVGCIREQDSAARLGGDEFVVLLEGLSGNLQEAVAQAEHVAEKIRAALAQPYLLNCNEDIISHHCSSSIGVSVFREHDETMEHLLKWTDMAMYRAKDAGRNAIRFFDPDMQVAIENRAALEADLHTALEQQQFKLFYQVQVNNDGKPQGAEVLLRWLHPQRGLVSPAQFIPLAEETGLIMPMGAWVLDTACAQLRRWQDSPVFRELTLAVNVSAKQFRQPDFVAQVQTTVRQHGINPALLKLELTESLVLENVADTIAKMMALRSFGVSFSMDDFGTGYSSLSYLKLLPLNQIKIDQSFVRDISTDKADLVLVMTIVNMGMNFGMDVIAEGVETDAQLKLLQQSGCASFQGYLFGKPVAVQEFEALLSQMMSGGI